MATVDLHEILAIYFDLTGRPWGKKIVMGEIGIDEYVTMRIKQLEEDVLYEEDKLGEMKTPRMKKMIKSRLSHAKEQLKRAQLLQEERGSGREEND